MSYAHLTWRRSAPVGADVVCTPHVEVERASRVGADVLRTPHVEVELEARSLTCII